jgi:peptidoglycan/xylan/chitin deacetylase (PgdA/CDA1 family)
VLKKHHVQATFFVVGSAVVEHPGVARRIIEEGHEIGVHTLTRADLGSAPDWRRQLEVQGAQQVIMGVTGQAASCCGRRTAPETTRSQIQRLVIGARCS